MYEQTRSYCFRLMMAPMSVASSDGIADLQGPELRGELGQEGFEDRAMEEQSRPRRARLPLAGDTHPRNDAVHRASVVCIRKDDRRALAAELERHRDDAIRRRVHDKLADLGGPGE